MCRGWTGPPKARLWCSSSFSPHEQEETFDIQVFDFEQPGGEDKENLCEEILRGNRVAEERGSPRSEKLQGEKRSKEGKPPRRETLQGEKRSKERNAPRRGRLLGENRSKENASYTVSTPKMGGVSHWHLKSQQADWGPISDPLHTTQGGVSHWHLKSQQADWGPISDPPSYNSGRKSGTIMLAHVGSRRAQACKATTQVAYSLLNSRSNSEKALYGSRFHLNVTCYFQVLHESESAIIAAFSMDGKL
jgi:hypothetical protein